MSLTLEEVGKLKTACEADISSSINLLVTKLSIPVTDISLEYYTSSTMTGSAIIRNSYTVKLEITL